MSCLRRPHRSPLYHVDFLNRFVAKFAYFSTKPLTVVHGPPFSHLTPLFCRYAVARPLRIPLAQHNTIGLSHPFTVSAHCSIPSSGRFLESATCPPWYSPGVRTSTTMAPSLSMVETTSVLNESPSMLDMKFIDMIISCFWFLRFPRQSKFICAYGFLWRSFRNLRNLFTRLSKVYTGM